MTDRRRRCLALLAVAGGAAIAFLLHERVPQDPGYHRFADERRILGVPNFWNAVSNLPFAVTGLAGLIGVARSGSRRPPLAARQAWALFFGGTMAVAFGSAWYHLAPSDERLAWDRLAMSVAFTSLLAAVLGEWVDPRAARRLLPLLVLGGTAAVGYWHFSELRGAGDLRPYIIVQFLPLLLIPAILILFPAQGVKARYVWTILGMYAAAKVFELLDAELFRAGGIVSGHTLKHLAAAAGAYSLVRAVSDVSLCPLCPRWFRFS